MTNFDYHEPASLEEAVALLSEHGDEAHVIAGGTSVVLMLRQGLIHPGHLVGLRKLPELERIRVLDDGTLEIGALATHRAIQRSETVGSFFPALREPFGHVATVRIRNQGTIGGNLVHADPAQDPPPMLLALDAQAVAVGSDGPRTIPLNDFFVDFFETALRQGEILTAVRVPKPKAGTRATYVKFLPQSKDDYATVSVAVVLWMSEGGICEDVRIALGAVGSIPMRVARAEGMLKGNRVSDALIEEVAAAVGEDVDPLDDVRGSSGYKRGMARVWTKRAIAKLVDEGPAR